MEPEELIIDEWMFADAIAFANETSSLPTEEALARFTLGWTSDAEEEAILSALVRSPSLRQRLIEFDEAKATLARVPLAKALAEPFPQSLLASLRRVLTDSLAFYTDRDAFARWLSQDTAADEKAAGTVARAMERALRERPVLGISPVRSRTTEEHADELRGGFQVMIAIEKDPHGGLSVTARIPEWPSIRDRGLTLRFENGAASFPLARATVTGPQTRFDLDKLAAPLGLTVDHLRPDQFKLFLEAEESETPLSTLRCELRTGQEGRILRCRLAEEPLVRAGTLTVIPIVPNVVTQEFRGGSIELSLQLGMTGFLLGRWAVPAEGGPFRLEAEIGAVADGRIAFSEVLLLRFLPPEG